MKNINFIFLSFIRSFMKIKTPKYAVMNVLDPPVTTLGPGYRCPAGWSGFGDNCYFMYTLSKLSYSDVQQKCKDLGGDLASIHSDNENSFILALAHESKRFLLTPFVPCAANRTQ